MTGLAEVPGPGAADPASGSALVTVDAATNDICINIATTGIGAYTGLHIHAGASGVSGPAIVDFAPPAGTTNSLRKCVVNNNASAIVSDPSSFYVNVHTADFPAGALRDQLAIRDSEIQLLATPVRAYDSRAGTDGKLTNSATRVIDLSAYGVPIGVRGAIINLTATRADGTGYVVVYSNALSTAPGISTVNFGPSDVANDTTVAVDGAGKIKVTVGPTGATDILIDVMGYVI